MIDELKKLERQCAGHFHEYNGGGRQIVVVYHASCADGFCSAYLLHKAFEDMQASVCFVPLTYNDRDSFAEKFKALNDEYHMFVVDFSFNYDQIYALINNLLTFVILDHHEGAKDDVALAERICKANRVECTAVFDNDKSGCQLTWDFLNQDMGYYPAIVKYTADRDLWRFQYEDTRAYMAAVFSYPMDFKVWDSFNTDDLLVEGQALLRQQEIVVRKLVSRKNVAAARLGDVRLGIVNCPKEYVSEACNALLEMHPEIDVAMGYQYTADGAMYSFRARKGGVYLPDLIKKYGGGGHQAAAGLAFDNLHNDQQYERYQSFIEDLQEDIF